MKKSDDFLKLTQKIENLKEKISKTEKILLTKHHKNISKNLRIFINSKTKLFDLKNT